MNDLTPVNQSGALMAPQRNFFEQYAEAVSGNRIVGDLLKFNKGDWLKGKDASELPKRTRLIANVADIKIGWQRWEGGKPTDTIVGRVVDGFMAPARSTLGDTDESLWEPDLEGKPRDPWAFINVLIFKEEHGDGLMTYSPSTKTAHAAIAPLIQAYGARFRARPNDVPVVELDSGSFMHSDKKIGRVKTPKFNIVGWTDKSVFDAALAAEAAEAEEHSDLPFEEAPAAAVTATGRARKPASAEF